MRILYHHRTQAEDGQAVHIRALQAAFRELGHEVLEVGLVSQGADASAAASNGAADSGRSRWSWVKRLPPALLELCEYGYGFAARGRLLREAAHFEPDFLYERYAFGNTAGVRAARRLTLPLVLEVNSPMVLELSRTRGLAFPRLARRTEDFVFHEATRVCVVTGVLGDMLAELGVERERLLVTPNGVHLEQYPEPGASGADGAARDRARGELGCAAAGPVLGFVGYYRSWHRLDLALECLLQPGLEDAALVLVGEGPAEAELVERARELGLAERLVLAGPRPHAAIPRLLPAFDVGLIPAINPYASPLKLHEYMAAGLAVVAPRQPNLCEVLEDGENALLFEPGDGDGLCAAVAALLGDAERARALGRRARATVVERDLTWTGNARRVLAAVEALAA